MEAERRMAGGRWWVPLVVILTIGVLVFVGLRSWLSAEADTPSDTTSTGLTIVAPDQRGEPLALSGLTLDEQSLDIADWRGDVVVINLWGSWCGPCREEAPGLVRVWRSTREQGVRFLGIDVKDNRAAANAYVNHFGTDYPSIFDEDASAQLVLAGHVPVNAIPSTLVLDREGRVAATVVGPVDEDTLRGLVTDVLAEPTAGSPSAPTTASSGS